MISGLAGTVGAQEGTRDFTWAVSGGGPAIDQANGIAMLPDGDMIVVGIAGADARFGEQTLKVSGKQDILIARYASPGRVVWVRNLTGTGSVDAATAVAVSADNRIYVTGMFDGDLTFGGTLYSSRGASDVFTACFDSNGKELWLRQGGGQNNDAAYAIAVRGDNVVVSGGFRGIDVKFDEFVFTGPEDLSSSIFIVSYTLDGQQRWGKQTTGIGDDMTLAAAIDVNDNIFLGGSFRNLLLIEKLQLTEFGGADIFIMKLDANGVVSWLRPAGGKLDDAAMAITPDNKGGAYLGGSFFDSAQFDEFVLTVAPPSQAADGFVAHYQDNGIVGWARAFASADADELNALFTQQDATLLAAGLLNGNVWVQHLAADGEAIQSWESAGARAGKAHAVVGDPVGNINFAGEMRAPLTFGETSLTPVGGGDMFLAQIGALLPDLRPELTVELPDGTPLGAGSAVAYGTALQVSLAVSNIGDAVSNGIVSEAQDLLEITLPTRRTPIFRQFFNAQNLEPGTTGAPRRFTYFPVDSGGLTFLAQADAGNVIPELNETNNLLQLPIRSFLEPQELFTNFENADTLWRPNLPAFWQIRQLPRGAVYCVRDTGFRDTAKPGLGTGSLLATRSFANLMAVVEYDIAGPDSSNPAADAALIYAFRDSLNYSYVLLSRQDDGSQIVELRDGEQVVLAKSTSSAFPGSDRHIVKLIAQTEGVEVLVNGLPFMQATPQRSLVGRFGLGTLESTPCFDHVRVAGDLLLNNPPSILGTPEPMRLRAGAPDSLIDLTLAFPWIVDPDGDALQYSVRAENPQLLRVTQDGPQVLLSPLAAGTTQLMIMVDDLLGGVTELIVQVQIDLPLNLPPLVINPLQPIMLPLDAPPLRLPLEGELPVFTDPDGDALTYFARVLIDSIARAVIEGSDLLITPLATGVTSVSLSASDGRDTTTTIAGLTILPGNTPPVLVNNLPAFNLTAGDEPTTFDLEGEAPIFNDPDGDTLTYMVTSSNDTVALAVISAQDLVITPLADGNSTITVTANDGKADSRPAVASVQVGTANRPPVAGSVPNLTLMLGDTAAAIALSGENGAFSDPDGDQMTFTATADSGGIVTLTITNDVLRVQPVSAGTTDILLTADDGNKGTAELRFGVEVLRANQAPVLVNPIPDTSFVLGSAVVRIPLEGETPVFSDPDGDSLTYGAGVETAGVVLVAVDSAILKIVPFGEGMTDLRISATDASGASAQHTFKVTVAPEDAPDLVHVSPDSLPEGSAQRVTAQLENVQAADNVRLLYRRGGERNYQVTQMAQGADGYEAQIPQEFITLRGVDYYFDIREANGNMLRFPPQGNFTITVFSATGLSRTEPQPRGLNANNYRLISLPLNANIKDAGRLWQAELGEYDRRIWRLFGLDASQEYVEYPEFDGLAPGCAFWLIIRDTDFNISTGPGLSVATDQPFRKPLHAGWNLIANPYSFLLPVSQLSLSSDPNGAVLDLREFDGVWQPEGATVITPFAGYALFSNTADTLLINPDLPPVDNTRTLSKSQPQFVKNLDWHINIVASADAARDIDNVLGVSSLASDSWDIADREEPPSIGSYVSVAFVNEGWQRATSHYASDIRSTGFSGRWQFEVVSSESGLLNLDFSMVDLPDGLRPILRDVSTGVLQDLSQQPRYSYISTSPDHPRAFQLSVSDVKMQDALAASQQVERFQLHQNYPNPFNPATLIRFDVPEASPLSLTIYNIRGERIRSLLQKSDYPAGSHTLIWDGRDDRQRDVAAGLYIYRLQAGTNTAVRKMLLVR